MVDPVDDTVALGHLVVVAEFDEVFDGGRERVPVTLLRNVAVIKGDNVAVLVVRVVAVVLADTVAERDDLNETVALELPVDVFETVIDDVWVRVRRPVYDDRTEAEFDGELLDVFDLGGEYVVVGEELDVLDNTTEREFVGLAVAVLVLLIEPVLVFDLGGEREGGGLEVPVFDANAVTVCWGLDELDLVTGVLLVLVLVDVAVRVESPV